MSKAGSFVSTIATMLSFSILFTLLMSSVHNWTEPKIKSNERLAMRALLLDLIQGIEGDNNPLEYAYKKPAIRELGVNHPQTIYPIFHNNKPHAVIFSICAPNGYGGPICAMLAVSYNGKILGVRVLSHKETPGLGDYIDGKHGVFSYNWLRQFWGKTFTPDTHKNWAVKKDGGTFEYMTGATISPRALVTAISTALKYYLEHRDDFYSQQKK